MAVVWSTARFESCIGETFFLVSEVDFALENLKEWMAPTKVPTPLISKPASSKIMHDPKGVVLVRVDVRGAWRRRGWQGCASAAVRV